MTVNWEIFSLLHHKSAEFALVCFSNKRLHVTIAQILSNLRIALAKFPDNPLAKPRMRFEFLAYVENTQDRFLSRLLEFCQSTWINSK